MGCFLLQKKHSLNALDFVGFIAPHFPRKISPKYRTYTLHHHTASHLWQGVPSWEEWGGHRHLFCPCAGMRIRRHRRCFVVANA